MWVSVFSLSASFLPSAPAQSVGVERKEEVGRVGINGPHGRTLTTVRPEAGAPGVSKGQEKG